MKHKPYHLPDIPLPAPAGGDDPAEDKRKTELYRSVREYMTLEWDDAVRAFEANPCFHNAWRYITLHPIYWRMEDVPAGTAPDMRHLVSSCGWEGVTTLVMRVNPATGRISGDKVLNTRTEVWLETGEFGWNADMTTGNHYHNPDLDVRALTFEDATVALALNIRKCYGHDRRRCAPQWHERKRAKQDARIKERMGPNAGIWHVRPHAHVPCAWERPRGLAARLALLAEERA